MSRRKELLSKKLNVPYVCLDDVDTIGVSLLPTIIELMGFIFIENKSWLCGEKKHEKLLSITYTHWLLSEQSQFPHLSDMVELVSKEAENRIE